jgi:jumonji domain-containing protein 2
VCAASCRVLRWLRAALRRSRFSGPAWLNDDTPPARRAEEELARQFWRGVELNPPLYGADLPMSLFDEALPFGCVRVQRHGVWHRSPPRALTSLAHAPAVRVPRSWNLRRLGCLLQQARVPSIPGVTSPMCYVGSWRANFAWHTEDADLYSINYLHTGAPKSWYCVPPAARARFESAAAAYFPQLARSCPAFLRHKDIMISPTVLRQHGIPFTCTVQRAGEFVVNTAGAYHCGFNHGFNLAEAVNFATPSWPAIGRNAQRCLCCSDAVSIDMRLFGGAAAVAEAKADAAAAVAAACSSSPRRGAKAAASGAAAAAVHTPPPKTSAGDVVAVVGQDASRKRYMYLGRVLGAGALGCVRLEWLKPDDADGVYRAAPSAEPWEEEEEALITAIRYDVVAGAHAGIRLRTSAATLLGARLTSDEKPAKRAREK